MKPEVTIEPTDPQGDDAAGLLRDRRAEVRARYADVIDTSIPPAKDSLVPRSTFLIARLDGEIAGCGAIRPMDAETAEVRRMYVVPAMRRRGVARCLLAELERQAIEFGYLFLRLETGNRQPEAIALYDSSGFRRIAPYGPYIGDPLSICFEKRLAPVVPGQAD